MKYVQLGQTGLSVSQLCLGTLTLGPLQKNLPLDEAAELLAAALDLGVNFWDTAQLYDNYPALAAGLAKRPNAEVVLVSKTFAYETETARTAVEQARKSLNRDVIDVFLLHQQESAHTLRGHAPALEVLMEYKAAGHIRAVGLSTHHVAGVHAAVDAGLDVVSPLINVTGMGIADGTRANMEAAVLRAHEAGLGVYAMKALAGGHHYQKAAEALDYAMTLPGMDSVAVGVGSLAELRDNVDYFNGLGFSQRYYDNLRSQRRKIFIDPGCDNCGQCAQHCRLKALSSNGVNMTCDHERCTLCAYCAAYCEKFFIKIL